MTPVPVFHFAVCTSLFSLSFSLTLHRRQVKLAALDISHRQECLIKTGELKHHVKELEKQVRLDDSPLTPSSSLFARVKLIVD